MSDYINDALLDASHDRKLKEESKAIVNKWEKTGLLEDISTDYDKSGMAILLENQAKQLIKENSGTGGRVSGGADGSGSEEWSGVALPLVRRIFSEIAAKDFVSVQPMNLPSGLIFYLDFKYGIATAGKSQGGSLYGTTGKFSPSGSSAVQEGTGGFYGAGAYGYTMNTASAALKLPAATAVSDDSFFDYDSAFSASNAGNVWYVDSTSGSLAGETGFDKKDDATVRSWKVSIAGTGTEHAQYRKMLSNGKIRFLLTHGSQPTPAVTSMEIYNQPTAADRGDYEDSAGDATVNTLKIPEIDLQLRSEPIVAKTRKLKAVWTPELAQDLNAYHSVDAEAELTSMLSEYISMEIDLEILDMLMAEAPVSEAWSAEAGMDFDSSSNSFVNNGFYGTRFEWYQTLGQKIQKVSNKIHALTMRGGANFIVCGPTVATIIESIPGFGVSTNGDKDQFAMGVQAVGQLQNRWTVYKNPYMQENRILVGFRGSNFLETGAVYAPYVPLIMTPLVYDPSDFTPRKGVMTRYAKKMVRPEFYGTIDINRLDLV